ncbi:hypothetical protein [Methylobacterium aquaticum]|uniref:hypothetical protein n=1 Tax=Methylobacterium aquaticum TaxID=270351 RepID=UPI00193117F1|nr:hypothetical protein [Methylobacterium aquaticum]
MTAPGAPAAGCVQSHRDDEAILASLDKPCDAALGDGQENAQATDDEDGGSPIIGRGQSAAIPAK